MCSPTVCRSTSASTLVEAHRAAHDDGHHRRRTGRARHEPLPVRARHRARRARTWEAGAALAQPELGFAASVDAELDDPPSGIPVRRPRPGRLHVRPGTDCVLRTLRRLVGGTGPDRHGRAKRRAIGRTASASSPTAASGRRLPWWWRPDTAICRPFLPRAAGWRRRSGRSCPRTTDVPNNCRPAASSSSALLPPACSSPTRFSAPDGRSRWPSAVTRDCLDATADATSSGGWIELGVLSQGADAVHDIERSRHQPSLQLVGRPDHSSLDLAVLHDRGVRLVGRVRDIDGHRVSLADDLVATTAAADIKMAEILTRIDQFIATTGVAADVARAVPPDLAPCCRHSRQPRSEGRAHQHGDLGNGLSARVPVAARPGSRCSRRNHRTRAGSPRRPGSTCSA